MPFFRLSHTTLIQRSGINHVNNKQHEKNSSYVREEEPGFLENLGVKYYRYLGKKSGTAGLRNLTIDELPADVTLQTLAGNITAFAAIIAFAIGALTTFVTIWVEWTYEESMDRTAYYLLYGSVLAVMLVIELAVLYWLGLKRFSVWRA
jgi:hypothetical protein